jgi:homopolymeric O-antigen transport system permease protein
MLHIITAYRAVLIDGHWPDWRTLAAVLAAALLFGSWAVRYFQRSRLRFLEEL